MSQGKSNSIETEETIRIDETSTPNTIYIGYSNIATATSSATWKIKRIYISTSTDIKWADGNSDYDNIWDDRIILTYN